MNDSRLNRIPTLVYGNYSVHDDVVKVHFLQPPAQALDELAAVVSDVERDDDEVVVIYLLGSILNREMNESSLPINVTAAKKQILPSLNYCTIIIIS